MKVTDRIASYVEGMTRSAFEADQMRVDAVIRNLQIIGEAVKHNPPIHPAASLIPLSVP